MHIAILFLTLLAGCRSVEGARQVQFDDIFEEAERVVLEEVEGHAITRVYSIALDGDSGFIVLDRVDRRVLLFSRSGALVHVIGRYGGGPGEFRFPVGAVRSADGRLFVYEPGDRRISRFGADFRFEASLPAPDSTRGGSGVLAHGNEIILQVLPHWWSRNQPVFVRVDAEGEPLGAIHPQDSAYVTVPYWSQYPESISISGDGNVVVANPLTYPLHRYQSDGRSIGTFGTPPPSWRQASRPRRGEFMGADGLTRHREWLRTFTWIDQVAHLSDTLLVVAHGELDPTEMRYEDARFRVDVYDRRGVKLHEDLLAPGRLLVGGEQVYFLTGEPPEGWTISSFVLRN